MATRAEIDAKYGKKSSPSSVTTDGKALQVQPAATSSVSARAAIDAKYSGKGPVATTTKTTTPPPAPEAQKKPGIISRVIDKGLNLIDRVIGRPDDEKVTSTSVAKNTLTYLPSSFVESLPFGFGTAIKAIRDNPELAAEVAGDSSMQAIKNLAKETPKAAVEAGKEFIKAPIRGGSNLAIVPVHFNIPGLGEVSNAQYNAAYRVERGEDPTVVALEEGANAIFDTLFFVGLVSKPFTARPQTIMRGEITPPKGSTVTTGPKSFRSYEPPTTARPLSPAFIEQMRAQGTPISPKYNPANPTFFRITERPGGVLRGEVIQLRPSYFDTIKTAVTNKFSKPAEGLTLYHGTSHQSAESIRQNGFDLSKSRLGEEGARSINFAKNPTDAAHYASVTKNGEVITVKFHGKNIKTFENENAYLSAIEAKYGDYTGSTATKFNQRYDAVIVKNALPGGDYVMVTNPKNITIAQPPAGQIPATVPLASIPKDLTPEQGEVVYSQETSVAAIEDAVKKPAIQMPDGGDITPHVNQIAKAPITSEILETIKEFTPQETSAFGRNIIQRINKDIGTNITEAQGSVLPENMKLNDQPSPDGRPAQFNNQGKIEVFMPNLMKDIADMAKGGKILAHPDTPKFSKVYELKSGESVEDLAVRYVQDVLIHEQSHADTMTLQDMTRGQQLNQEWIQARASGNKTAMDTARRALDQHLESLEIKALEYERANRGELMKKISLAQGVDVRRGDSTPVQRKINQNIKGGADKKVTISEKRLVKEGIKIQARGARAGFKEAEKIGEEKVKEVKVGYEAALETLKDKNATVQQRRYALVKYAEAFLPVTERGKFIRSINYPGSEANFREILTRMQKASDTVTRKGLVSEIMAELKGTTIKRKNGLPNVKFELESQRKLNKIRANIRGDYGVARLEMAKIISEYQTANPDSVLPDDLIGEIQLLKMVGIQDMTAKELRGVLADIQSIKETGRTLREVEKFNRDSEIERARDQILDVISGKQVSPQAGKSIKQAEERTRLQGAKEFLTTQQYGLEEILDSLSKFDKDTKPYQSFLSKYVGERVNKAFNQQNEGEITQIEMMNNKLKDIFELKKNSEVLAEINEMRKVVDLGKVVHADGIERTLQISRGQAIQMKMWLEDPELAPTFADTLNWGDEVIDVVTKFLRPEDIKLANYLVDEFYPKYYETINPVFVKEFGIDLPFNPKYSPVSRDVETTIPENVLLAKEIHQYATARNNSLKSRVRNKIELKTTDALENLTRHIVRMEHYKAWSESMQEFRKIFGNKEVRQAVIDFHGKTTLDVLDNFLNDFARDGVSREKIVRAVDTLRSNATKALLGLNWRVGFKQMTGVFNYAIEMPLTDFFSGIASFWSDPLGKATFLRKNSGALRERFGDGFERDIKFAISKGYDKTLAKTKNVGELMFIMIRSMDKLTVYHGSWAAYRSGYMTAKKEGKSDAEAKAAGIANAENITNRIQESSRLDTLSPLQRAGSLAKLFTMFQSQPSKYLRVITNSARNFKYGRGSKITHTKRILWAWFVVPFIYNLIAEQFVDEKYQSTGKGVLLKTALGPLSYPLITGQMFQSIYGWTAGERFNYTPSAVFAFLDDIQKSIDNLKTGDITEATTYLIDTIGKLRGTPTGIFTRPFRNSLKDNE